MNIENKPDPEITISVVDPLVIDLGALRSGQAGGYEALTHLPTIKAVHGLMAVIIPLVPETKTRPFREVRKNGTFVSTQKQTETELGPVTAYSYESTGSRKMVTTGTIQETAIVCHHSANDTLVVGFDTEYYEPMPGLGNGRIPLSYQLYGILGGYEWGIVYLPPVLPLIKPTLAHLLYLLLTDDHSPYGTGKLDYPTTLTLAAHWTTVDFMLLGDRLEIIKKCRNIRKSVTGEIENPWTDGTGNIHELKINIVDTILLTPADTRGLVVLGNFVGLPKFNLPDGYSKENMMPFRAERIQEFIHYGITDAAISAKFYKRFSETAATMNFEVKPTLSGCALSGFKTYYKPAEFLELFGYYLKTKKYRAKDGTLRHRKIREQLPDVERHVSEMTDCYHGGLNQSFLCGRAVAEGFDRVSDQTKPPVKKQWHDYDLNAAYGTVLSALPRISWKTIKKLREGDCPTIFKPTTIGGGRVRFKFPAGCLTPCLPHRDEEGRGLIYALEGESSCSAPEIWLALKMGATIEVLSGWHYPTDPTDKPFLDFFQKCIKERRKHPKYSLPEQLWKTFVNSLYGKVAQGLRYRTQFNIQDMDVEVLPPCEITNPAYASYITGFVRAVLLESIHSCRKAGHQVASVTTDGFTTTCPDLITLENGTLSKHFSWWRGALVNDPSAYDEKKEHRGDEIISLKTRGQFHPDGSRAFTGLKVPKNISNPDEWAYNAVMRAKPGDTQDVELFYSIRDYLEGRAHDVIPYTRTQKIPVNFDFKQIPLSETLTFDEKIQRVSFWTRPPHDIAEFERWRSRYASYVKTGRNPYESVEAFQSLILYVNENAPRLTAQTKTVKQAIIRVAVRTLYVHIMAGKGGLYPKPIKTAVKKNGRHVWTGKRPSNTQLAAVLSKASGMKITASQLKQWKRRERPQSHSILDKPEVRQLISDVQDGLHVIGYSVTFDVALLLEDF